MKLYEFNSLVEDKKATILLDQGVYLMNRIEGSYIINLHSLFDLYVEVWYDYENNRIVKFRTFKSLKELKPYLDRIQFNSIFE
ncbi:MAG: hypothetical protein V1775_02735 [Bacteroidota bacterium]